VGAGKCVVRWKNHADLPVGLLNESSSLATSAGTKIGPLHLKEQQEFDIELL
jgi:hypothetical protein